MGQVLAKHRLKNAVGSRAKQLHNRRPMAKNLRRLKLGYDYLECLLRVAENHPGVLIEKKRILHAGKTKCH